MTDSTPDLTGIRTSQRFVPVGFPDAKSESRESQIHNADDRELDRAAATAIKQAHQTLTSD